MKVWGQFAWRTTRQKPLRAVTSEKGKRITSLHVGARLIQQPTPK
jgi:hypothetical protein